MGNIVILKNKLLYKRDNGECVVVDCIKEIGSRIKVVSGYGAPNSHFETEVDDFHKRTQEYKPKWMDMDETVSKLEHMGLPKGKIEKSKMPGKYLYKIKYKSDSSQRITDWYLEPFYNNDEIFFQLRYCGSNKIYIITPKRYQTHVVDTGDKMSDEELDEMIKRLSGNK